MPFSEKGFCGNMISKINTQWIIGFVEGDGHFRFKKDSSGYNRCAFVVSQDQRSSNVLYAIQEFFSCGSVHKAGGHMMEYSVGNRQDLSNIILPFFNSNNFITEHRWNQFSSMCKIINNVSSTSPTCYNNSVSTNMPSLDWISGFIDAEGCFYVSVFNSKDTKIGVRVIPKLFIGLGKNEALVLHKIKKQLGVGYVRQRKDSSWIYEVSALEDLMHIAGCLESNGQCLLHTSKKLSFLNWKLILDIMHSKGHHTLDGLDKIRLLKSQINPL